MKKEIEVRIEINDQSLDIVKKWLDKNAKYIGEVAHKEYYLNRPESTFFLLLLKVIKTHSII